MSEPVRADLEESHFTELRRLVDEVDRRIPKENARVALCADDWNITRGTQFGYLRLGIEFIKAALEPMPATSNAPRRVGVDLDYLLTTDSKSPFGLCELRDTVENPPFHRHVQDRMGKVLRGAFVLILVSIFVVGVATVASWVLR